MQDNDTKFVRSLCLVFHQEKKNIKKTLMSL